MKNLRTVRSCWARMNQPKRASVSHGPAAKQATAAHILLQPLGGIPHLDALRFRVTDAPQYSLGGVQLVAADVDQRRAEIILP